MSVAKALSSAYLPISAVLIPEYMYEPMIDASGEVGTFGHGFTYSGHPVCAAVALRTLELMEEREIFAHAPPRWEKSSSIVCRRLRITRWSAMSAVWA